MNKQWIEKTKHKSTCCDALIHYEHVEERTWKSSRPFCSACLGEPPVSREALKKALRWLKTRAGKEIVTKRRNMDGRGRPLKASFVSAR